MGKGVELTGTGNKGSPAKGFTVFLLPTSAGGSLLLYDNISTIRNGRTEQNVKEDAEYFMKPRFIPFRGLSIAPRLGLYSLLACQEGVPLTNDGGGLWKLLYFSVIS